MVPSISRPVVSIGSVQSAQTAPDAARPYTAIAMVRFMESSHCATNGVLINPTRATAEDIPMPVARTSAGYISFVYRSGGAATQDGRPAPDSTGSGKH